MSNEAMNTGISMGCALAMILSWAKNASIGCAIIHGFCSWLYVFYTILEETANV